MDHMLLEEGTEKDRNDIGTISEVLKRLQEIYVYSTSENAEYSYLDETRLFNEGKLAIYEWRMGRFHDFRKYQARMSSYMEGSELSHNIR